MVLLSLTPKSSDHVSKIIDQLRLLRGRRIAQVYLAEKQVFKQSNGRYVCGACSLHGWRRQSEPSFRH